LTYVRHVPHNQAQRRIMTNCSVNTVSLIADNPPLLVTVKIQIQTKVYMFSSLCCTVCFDLQLRGARPSTCYGSGVEEGLYHSDIIVYWQVTKYPVLQKQHP